MLIIAIFIRFFGSDQECQKNIIGNTEGIFL
jgi:hypothetical protein